MALKYINIWPFLFCARKGILIAVETTERFHSLFFWENGFICKCLDFYLVKNELIFCVWTHILGKWTCIVWYLNLYFVEINLYWVFELILCSNCLVLGV